MPTTIVQGKKLTSVDLRWDEVYYTNCPLISAANVDQELGWTKEEFKKIGVNYLYLRARAENDWYPLYVHILDNLFRFGAPLYFANATLFLDDVERLVTQAPTPVRWFVLDA